MSVLRRNVKARGERLLRHAAFAFACAALCAAAPAPAARAQSGAPAAEFTKLAAQLVSARQAAGPEPQAAEERALAILDGAALGELNAATPDVDALNRKLAAFVTHQPPIGEGYRVVRLAGSPAAYALLANFGLSGPSAVRVYAGAPGKVALAARVDRYAQKDFLDDYMELAPVDAAVPLFVTVAGRTDDLQTGVFTAWRFDGQSVAMVWASDILQQSSYQSGAGGFTVTYCGEPDDQDPRTCHGMERDRYAWQDGAWKRVEAAKLPAGAK